MPAPIDKTGMKFGRLTVVALLPSRGRKRHWRCLCECGRTTDVSASNIGRCTFSCGCLQQEARRKQRAALRHGMHGTPEYRAWTSMRSRCSNPKVQAFKNYGARGISVCERWASFENFFADMGERPAGLELDRSNNDGNYEPANCRWTTRSENVKNTRPRGRKANGQWAGGVSFVATGVDDVLRALEPMRGAA